MTSKIISNGILRAIAIIIGVALLLIFLFKIQSVLVYLIISGVISLIGRPIMLFLRGKLKFNDTLAVITTMTLFIAILGGIISLFIPLILEQSHNLSLLDIEKLQGNVEFLYIQAVEYFGLSTNAIEESLKDSTLLSNLDLSLIPDLLNQLIEGLGNFGIGLFSVLFISFFFLKDSKLFTGGLLTLLPKTKEGRLRKSFNQIKDLLSRYFIGLIFQLLILFTIYAIVLSIFGINNAIIIATLCAILNIIPYVGPLISALLLVLLTMSSNLNESFSDVILPKTIYVLIGFVIAQLVDNFFSQPIIFSKSVKSHPLEIFLIIIIAGLLFGITGLIVAIPFYTAIKVIAKEFLSEYRIVKKLTKDLDE